MLPPPPRMPKRKRAQLQKISLDKLPLARPAPPQTPTPSSSGPLLSEFVAWVDSYFERDASAPIEDGGGWWWPVVFADDALPGLGNGTSPGAKAFAKMRGRTLAEAVHRLVAQQYPDFAAAWMDGRIRPSLSLYACFPPQHILPGWLDKDTVNSGIVHDAITTVCRLRVQRAAMLDDVPATLMHHIETDASPSASSRA